MSRESISKKLRFDVFKRDGFQCQYCGSTPPSVVLEIDHIHPVSKGGKGQEDNLITSCFDCNRGKAAGLLTVAPQSVADKAAILAEKMAQLQAFQALQHEKWIKEEISINQVEDAFQVFFPDICFMPRFRESVRRFLQKMTVYEVSHAMNTACSKMYGYEKALKYFCGICWNIIKGDQDGSR